MRKACPFLFIIAVVTGIGTSLIGGAYGADFDRGKRLFEKKCSICHGEDGKGDGSGASAFNPRPTNLADPTFWQEDAVEKIEGAVKKGKGAMPPLDLKPDEISDVTDYILHAFKEK